MAILYGALSQADLAADRVTSIGVELIDDSIRQSVEEHNRQINALMALFVDRTTLHMGRFLSTNNERLQPLDENGRALPTKPSGHNDVAWPIHSAGTAWALNFIAREKITVGELARIANAKLDADARWMRDHLLAALFYKSTTNPWTFADPIWGSLSIYGLANGDATTYNLLTGTDASTTDDHLLFDASLDADTFVAIERELLEHPENGGDVLTFIPTNQRATVEALATFYPMEDPDLRQGLATTVLAGTLGVNVPGQVIGKVEKNWIIEWRSLPDDYLISVTTQGDRALRMREDEEPSLQGFKQVAERNDYPWYEKQLLRRAGFGAWNRVGAVIYKVAGSYAIPTGYTSPMP